MRARGLRPPRSVLRWPGGACGYIRSVRPAPTIWRAVSEVRRPARTSIAERPTRVAPVASLGAYFLLTKPRVIELLLVTTVPAMILADDGLPSLWPDRRGARRRRAGRRRRQHHQLLDRARPRPADAPHARHRPLAAGRRRPDRRRWSSGSCSRSLAFALLWSTANLLAASLAVSATLFYVFVYTIWLKPRSPQNIVIGGAAGAVPVLVGWAAVTGSLAAPAWVLFAIVFFWTPPHFWALVDALPRRLRRGRASRCCPVVQGHPRPRPARSSSYSFVVVAVSSTLVLAGRRSAASTSSPASVLGVMFIVQAVRLHARPRRRERAIKLFTFSNIYLALLFAAIAVDTLVRAA